MVARRDGGAGGVGVDGEGAPRAGLPLVDLVEDAVRPGREALRAVGDEARLVDVADALEGRREVAGRRDEAPEGVGLGVVGPREGGDELVVAAVDELERLAVAREGPVDGVEERVAWAGKG